jgi:hypothetical protein
MAHFSFTDLYHLTDEVPMNCLNMTYRNNNKITYSVQVLCLCGLDYS